MLKSILTDILVIAVFTLLSTMGYYAIVSFINWELIPNWEYLRVFVVFAFFFWTLMALMSTVKNAKRPK